MSKGISTGEVVYALGMSNSAKAHAQYAFDEANEARQEAQTESARADRAEKELARITSNAQSQIHILRARIEAHVRVENQLIDALKVDKPDHPMADREVVDALHDQHIRATAFDKEVIQTTWLSGVAPDGAILLGEYGRPYSKGGMPAYPMSKEEHAYRRALAEAMQVHKLSFSDIHFPEKITAVIPAQQSKVAESNEVLDRDDKKRFFTNMNKKNREEAEADYRVAESQLAALNKALDEAREYVERTQLDAEKKARVILKLNKLGIAMK
jgi:hypothetical protein